MQVWLKQIEQDCLHTIVIGHDSVRFRGLCAEQGEAEYATTDSQDGQPADTEV